MEYAVVNIVLGDITDEFTRQKQQAKGKFSKVSLDLVSPQVT